MKTRFRIPQKIQKYKDYTIHIPNTTCCREITANRAGVVSHHVSIVDGVPKLAYCSYCRSPMDIPEITEEMFIECSIGHPYFHNDKYSRFLFKGETFEGWPKGGKNSKWKVTPRVGTW